MNLTERTRAQDIHVTTAYRWYRERKLPVSVVVVEHATGWAG